jgi:hypothetical protein
MANDYKQNIKQIVESNKLTFHQLMKVIIITIPL